MTSTNASEFDGFAFYAAHFPAEADGPNGWRACTESPAYRRRITRDNPLLFALIYLRHHLRDENGKVSFADPHLEWAERAKEWTTPATGPKESRHAEIAPRETGKSTWWFLILPLWAAAHGHLKFIAAFADSATQAELHLASFKRELETNDRLKEDFPDLVAPMTRGRGVLASDNRNLYLAKSGFAFAARGIDSGALGMKIGAQRPDLLLLDDVEPGESGYSLDQMEKRLTTIIDVILPLSHLARCVIVGTVTMGGSIIHQLVKAAHGDEVEDWIEEERFQPHHYLPILTNDDGSERSVWPARWPMEYLQGIRHTRSFAKNFANDPMGADGDYWRAGHFIRGELEGVAYTLISIDPAVTNKASSDFTGLAVVGYSPVAKSCIVKKAIAIKRTPDGIRQAVLSILVEFPEIGLALVETNQGGDTWKSILYGLPVPVKTVHQTVKKEVRAAEVLVDYERKRVIHAPGLDALEEQQVAFPNAPNDDLVDCVGSGVAYFLHRAKKKRAGAHSASYLS